MHRGLNTCECSSTSGVWGRTHCWGEAVPSVLKSKQVAKRGAPGCSPHLWQSSWQIHVWGQHDDESCQLMKQIRYWKKSWPGRTRAQNEQGLLDSSIGSGLNPQWTVRVRASRGAGQNQVWPGQLWGSKEKNLRHQITGWANQRIKLPFYILRHDLCWKSAIQVIYEFDCQFKGKFCANNIAVRIVCVERTKSRKDNQDQNVKAIKLLPGPHCT